MNQRPIAVFDLDFTLHRGSLVVLLLQRMVERGLVPRTIVEHPSVLEHVFEVRQGLRRDYAYAMLDQFMALEALEGIPDAKMWEVSEELVVEHQANTQFFPRLLLQAAKNQGYLTVAISGSPKHIVEPFARAWGFDDWLGTEFPVNEAGVLTGKYEQWTKHFLDKVAAADTLIAKHDATWEQSIAIGDSKDDLGMLKRATYPIAMNPSNELRQACRDAQIPVALEQGDGVMILQTDAPDAYFQEVNLMTVLPAPIAAEILEKTDNRVCHLGACRPSV